MHITNSSIEDLKIIFELFDSAIAYQKRKGYELWPRFSRQLIEIEIKEKRHWKIMEGDIIVCIFSVMYNDPVIWGEKDKDPAIYLHRITTNPDFKGKCMMEMIKHWAVGHAKQNNKKYLRMDTWGNNEILRNYYINCGFNYIGQQRLEKVEGLPEHYGGSLLSLFENEIK
ncbi:MAG TPA: GNAT family N-acetyltransferase [Bacteroidia bacterium]|jgi:hypothetical protein|nr:GNAT family N-acetyltransferase [Bacteroidia bacterium]